MAHPRNIRIGDVLKEYGYVTDSQIEQALAYQKEHKGVLLGEALIDLGFITDYQLIEALAAKLGLQTISMSDDLEVDIEAVQKIPRQLAEKYSMLAIKQEAGTLSVVMNDPLNFYGIEDVRQVTGMNLNILLTEQAALSQAIQYYYSEVSARKAVQKANIALASEISEIEEIELEEGNDDTPIINLLNSLIKRAYNTHASDIHIEPFEHKTVVRMRIDGVIVEYVTLNKNVHASLIARIKILGEMDIAERRTPQDGHFRLKNDTDDINIRISTIPTVFGEKAVLRLLANNAVIDRVQQYGMNEESYEKLKQILKSPNGIIYITGPTGSGKTTTLYMILEDFAKQSVNISTIEDPVEKNLPKVNQMQVNTPAGLTFGVGLRALLRQDPDVIMLGETRDNETATISARAAITGHLVFSTLHTNDAISSVVRLIDMGLEAYMVASSVIGFVAQRLMRKVCPECGEEVWATEEEKALLGFQGDLKIKKPRGCAGCNYTGYRDRVAIHEVLLIDKELRKMISANAAVEEMKNYAVNHQDFKSLRECAAEMVRNGISSMEEFLKISFCL